MTDARQTDERLRSWLDGRQPDRERMCAAILGIEGRFSNIELRRLEQWQKIWMVSPSDSIEHIWPVSKAPTKHANRLGNLVLLPPKLNSQLQASDPMSKADSYRKTGLLIAIDVADMIESGGWNKHTIESREEAILEWASREWAD